MHLTQKEQVLISGAIATVGQMMTERIHSKEARILRLKAEIENLNKEVKELQDLMFKFPPATEQVSEKEYDDIIAQQGERIAEQFKPN